MLTENQLTVVAVSGEALLNQAFSLPPEWNGLQDMPGDTVFILKPHIHLAGLKAVISDLDGVLVESFTTKILPGVLEAIASAKQHGLAFGVASNQPGPLWSAATQNPKYPDTSQLADKVVTIAKALDLTDAYWFIAIGDPRAEAAIAKEKGEETAQKIVLRLAEDLQTALRTNMPHAYVSGEADWRKPAPGMLLAGAKAWGIPFAQVLYIDDAVNGNDAANRAGMPFSHSLAILLTA